MIRKFSYLKKVSCTGARIFVLNFILGFLFPDLTNHNTLEIRSFYSKSDETQYKPDIASWFISPLLEISKGLITFGCRIKKICSDLTTYYCISTLRSTKVNKMKL